MFWILACAGMTEVETFYELVNVGHFPCPYKYFNRDFDKFSLVP